MNEYLNHYVDELAFTLSELDKYNYDFFSSTIRVAAHANKTVLVFGNGGSAAVAEHLSCDWNKGIANDSPLNFPRVQSLVSNQSLITAIANDYGYEHVFSKQIEYCQEDDALVLAISSSGNSANIVQGLKAAAKRGYICSALVGFDGGKVVSEGLAMGLTLHVKSHNYGIVEDAHSIIMHSIAQKLRLELSNDTSKIKL